MTPSPTPWSLSSPSADGGPTAGTTILIPLHFHHMEATTRRWMVEVGKTKVSCRQGIAQHTRYTTLLPLARLVECKQITDTSDLHNLSQCSIKSFNSSLVHHQSYLPITCESGFVPLRPFAQTKNWTRPLPTWNLSSKTTTGPLPSEDSASSARVEASSRPNSQESRLMMRCGLLVASPLSSWGWPCSPAAVSWRRWVSSSSQRQGYP